MTENAESRAFVTQTSTGTAVRMTRYRALLPIASGAMGTVHLGVRSLAAGVEPSVAIKRLHRRLTGDARARMMFRTEALCLSAIRHPNVVRFFDYDTSGGVQTLVMEYVDGATLSELALSGERLPLPIALSIALQMCAGLEAVQAAKDAYGRPLGIVHRDLSPQNVMVDLHGVARIIDFGVAQLANNPDPGLFGKVSYMAPEMLTSGVATSSSDLFAMAIVLWEMFAGRRLEDPDVPSLKSAVGDHARALDPIFVRALRREPSKRFASVADLRRALEQTGIVAADPAEVAAHVTRVLGAQSEGEMELLEERSPNAANANAKAARPLPPRSETWFPFDVDRPSSLRPEESASVAEPRRLGRFAKWAAVLALVGAVAGATSALAAFAADDAPPQPAKAQSLAG